MDLPVELKEGDGGLLVWDEHSRSVSVSEAGMRHDLTGDHEAVIVDQKSDFRRKFHEEAWFGLGWMAEGVSLEPTRGIIVLIDPRSSQGTVVWYTTP